MEKGMKDESDLVAVNLNGIAELEAKQDSDLPYNLVVIDTLKCVMDLAELNFGIGPIGVVMRLMQAVAARFNVAILWLHQWDC